MSGRQLCGKAPRQGVEPDPVLLALYLEGIHLFKWL